MNASENKKNTFTSKLSNKTKFSKMILFMIDEKLAEHPVSKNMLKNFEQISPILSVCFIINTGNAFPC